jgi:competence protein ComEA
VDINSIIERFRPHWLPIMVGIAGLFFLIYGLHVIATPKTDKSAIHFESENTKPEAKPMIAEKRITVDVEGAVQKPGVYSLPTEARVQDALLIAGGLASNADHDRVAKSLNLAAKVTDGGKIYIPFEGDPSAGLGSLGTDSGSNTVLGASVGTINLNTATASELDSLPGVGEVTAQKIINNRPYGASDDLVAKKVVSQKIYSQLKDKVTVY